MAPVDAPPSAPTKRSKKRPRNTAAADNENAEIEAKDLVALRGGRVGARKKPRRDRLQPGKRWNFPLPLELRLQIVGYLIDPNHIRKPANEMGGGAESWAYPFQTNLLRVNKSIAQDVTRVLYRDNTFVLVTLVGFEYCTVLLDICAVPRVCQNHEAEPRPFRQWSMHLEITLPRVTPNVWYPCVHALCTEYCSNDVVILQRDLPAFCHFLSWLFRWQRAIMYPVVDEAVTMELRFPGSLPRHRKLSLADQQALLLPFERCVYPGLNFQAVSIPTGLKATIRRLAGRMAPTEDQLDPVAMAWQLLEELKEFTALFHTLFKERQFAQIIDLKQIITVDLVSFWEKYGDSLAALSCEPLVKADIIFRDLSAYTFAAKVMEQAENPMEPEALGGGLDLAPQAEALGYIPPVTGHRAHVYAYPQVAWAEAIQMFVRKLKTGRSPRLGMRIVRQLAREFPDQAHFRSDGATMLKLYNQYSREYNDGTKPIQEVADGLVETLLKELSFAKTKKKEEFAPMTKTAYEYTRPAHIEGWVDKRKLKA